ncbi:MAG TPA: S9 family peptidase [Thermoanaerobaculia bacterium]|jgi:dipeptidyl aminopeptidase/acylaminoacyl peptidase
MMKRLLFIVLFTTTLFAQHPIAFEDLAAVRRIGAPHLSPDGKWVVYDASTIDLAANVRRSAIYLVPSDGSAPSRQISDGTKQDEEPAWSPDGKTIAYVSNREGGARQVYLYDLATQKTRRVTSLSGGAGSVKWLPDAKALVAVSDVYPECGVDPQCTSQKDTAAGNRPSKARVITSLLYRHWNAWQEPTRTHIVYVPLDGSAPRDLTPGAFDAPPFSVGGGGEFDVSPDGRELVYARNVEEHPERSTNADLYLVPISGGEAKRITTRTGADTSPLYSPDGRWIAYRSQSRNGYESDLWELWLYDRTSGTSKRIAADFPNWIESAVWSPDSRSLFASVPYKGKQAVYEIALDGKATLVNATGATHAIDVSRDGRTIAYEQSSLRRPTDIYVQTRGGEPRRITRDNDALLAKIAMGETRDLWWTGADDAQVQGHLITPPNFDPSKKYPGIVLIHGGPQGAWADAWSYRWNPQLFAARGYVVLMPNPRGSTGFGQQFVEQISGDWGGRVYTDIMNGVDKLAALPYVDGSRLGAAGGSYGGYMVDWILGHSTRFKALVSHAGVYNLESMYGVTEELWFPEFEFGGPFWEQPETYARWSPHRFVKNFATPTLVTHGELDYRVPVGEGMQLFTALQRRGIQSKMVIFPDEGHWVLKPQNSKLWYQTVGDWFDQWVK